jgi:hypothetical protein
VAAKWSEQQMLGGRTTTFLWMPLLESYTMLPASEQEDQIKVTTRRVAQRVGCFVTKDDAGLGGRHFDVARHALDLKRNTTKRKQGKPS